MLEQVNTCTLGQWWCKNCVLCSQVIDRFIEDSDAASSFWKKVEVFDSRRAWHCNATFASTSFEHLWKHLENNGKKADKRYDGWLQRFRLRESGLLQRIDPASYSVGFYWSCSALHFEIFCNEQHFTKIEKTEISFKLLTSSPKTFVCETVTNTLAALLYKGERLSFCSRIKSGTTTWSLSNLQIIHFITKSKRQVRETETKQ